MNPAVLLYGIAILLFAHGLGHVVGYWGPTRDSWLLSRWVSGDIAWAIEVVWMGLSVVLFISAAVALLDFGISHDQWRTLAIIAASVSAVGLVIFWGTWPESSAFSAFVFDLVVIVVLVVLNWPSESALGFAPTESGTGGR